ncbi:MAG: hypothetical protein U1E31_00835 [Rickettsiales bacterium]
MGIDYALAHTSIRISFGVDTTKEEVEYAAYLIVKSLIKLKEMSLLFKDKTNLTFILSLLSAKVQ